VQPLLDHDQPGTIIALFRVINRYVGNLPPISGVFPDYPAPVVRNTDHGTELIPMRWGMPPPVRTGGPPVTDIRNTSSPHWRAWLKPEHRCRRPPFKSPVVSRR
jgi:putative SOS response-associated peptidase YedK